MVCSEEYALSNSVIVLFVSIVVSMEINRRHYFWSGLRTYIFCTSIEGWIQLCFYIGDVFKYRVSTVCVSIVLFQRQFIYDNLVMYF